MTTARSSSFIRFLGICLRRSLDTARHPLMTAQEGGDGGGPGDGSGPGPAGGDFWKAIAALIFLGALLSESLTPANFAHGSLYLLSVLAAGLSLDRAAVFVATVAGVCGIIFGFGMNLDADLVWLAADRLLSAVALIATGALAEFLLREREYSRRQDVVLRKADDALLEKERRLENAERIGESGSWEVDPGRGLVVCSQNFADLFGPLSHSGLGSVRKLLALVPAPDRAPLLRSMQHAMKDRAPVDVIHGLQRPDGTSRRVRTMADILDTEDGLVLSGVTRDITDRLAAEERLIEGEVHQRFAGQIGRIGGWRYDRATDRLIRSEQAAAIRGHCADVAPTLEETICEVASDCRPALRGAFSACLDRGRPFDLVVEVTEPRPLWMRISGEPTQSDGKIFGARGAIQDVTELVVAQQESRDTASRLERTLDQMSDGFFLLDEHWRFSFVNRRLREMTGAASVDIIGKTLWEAFPATIGSDFEARYREAVITGTPTRFVSFFAPLDKWFLIEAEPTPDGLAVFAQDVTRQRADEEQLRLLSVATARLNDMILISDGQIEAPETGPRILYANDAFERQTGFSMGEILGGTAAFLFGEQTEEAQLAFIAAHMARGESCRTELTYHRKNGEAFTAEVEFVPITEGETITHWVAVGRDISERKRFMDELQLSEERFRLVTRATNDVIYDWNLADGEIWFSENVRDLLSQVPPAPGGEQSPFAPWVEPEDRARVEESVLALLSGSRSVTSLEYGLRYPDKGHLQMMEDAFALRGQDGRAARIIGSLKDVTLLRAQQTQLRDAQKLEATGRLTGGIAHDFNNLLTIIIGTTELMEDHAVDNQALKRLTETAIAAAERGAELTRHLLAFARRQPLAPQRVEVNALIGGMRPLFLRALTESVEFETGYDPAAWPTMVDKNQLENALLNLVINARHAMPQGGHLKIETGNRTLEAEDAATRADMEPGEYVMIAVSDDGEGMTRDVAERVFEPFFTTRPVGEGSGMGLSMVYGFIKQSRGHIAIYSEPGEGTVVRLYLPRCDAVAADGEGPEPEPEAAAGGEHILVVEDDAQLRKNVARQLASLGYRLTLAGNGAEALSALETAQDVVLLFTDIVMPGGMNGREVAERARAKHPGLKVVYTSGYTQDARVQQGRAEASIRFLSKPYRRRDLARVIREALEDDRPE